MFLTKEQFISYLKSPLDYDSKLRDLFKISDSKYYSVSVWPEDLAGQVTITPGLVRVVKTKKISKSDQS